MVVDLTFSYKQRSLVTHVTCPSEYDNIFAQS